MKIFIFLLFFLSSCAVNDQKEYSYIETAMHTSINSTSPKENKPLQIIALSDSGAHLKAYLNFCLSNKYYNREFQKSGTVTGKPLSFKLLNKESVDISKTFTFLNKESLENKIRKNVLSFEVPKNRE
ncbi:MAG: hypothetical protein ABIP30_02290 [Ferruginibacter sp.]